VLDRNFNRLLQSSPCKTTITQQSPKRARDLNSEASDDKMLLRELSPAKNSDKGKNASAAEEDAYPTFKATEVQVQAIIQEMETHKR